MDKNNIKKRLELDWFEYELDSPIHYSDGGKRIPTTTVYIYAPHSKIAIQTFELEQMISLALTKFAVLFKRMSFDGSDNSVGNSLLSDQNSQNKEGEIEINKEGEVKEKNTEKESINFLEASEEARVVARNSDLNMEKAVNVFGKLAQLGCVKVGEKDINYMQWANISPPDKMEIFFRFVGIFVIPSLS